MFALMPEKSSGSEPKPSKGRRIERSVSPWQVYHRIQLSNYKKWEYKKENYNRIPKKDYIGVGREVS
jgi:hypothetical protein